jgi:hypothetical protein
VCFSLFNKIPLGVYTPPVPSKKKLSKKLCLLNAVDTLDFFPRAK